MLIIPVEAIPNQTFPVVLSDSLFNITLKTIFDMTYMSMSIDDVEVLDNARCCANMPIIPSVYEEKGNFMFLSNGFQLPYYTNFNTTQILVYFTPEELQALRAVPQPAFNPIAALPIRYDPSINYEDPLLTTESGIIITTADGVQIAVARLNENPNITTNTGALITDQDNNPITT